MKKKLLFGFIILTMVLAVVLSACTPTTTPTTPPPLPEKTKIVYGMSRSLSGPLAQIGDSAFRPVYETYFKQINDAGGLFIPEYNKKLPIETLIYDDKSDTGTMTRLLEKLIVEDKVDFVGPPVGTAMVFAAAPIANKYGYVLCTAEGGATTMTDILPSLPYVFVNLSYSDWYQLPVLAEMLKANGVKTAYVTYIADLHGVEYSGVAGYTLPPNGIEIVAVKSLPPDIKDVSPILKEAQSSGADAFLQFAYPDQNILATAQAMQLGYNPKFFLTGPGANFGFYHDIFGPAVEGVSCFAVANRKTNAAMKEMFDTLYTGKPEALNDWWGHPLYWAGIQFWRHSVESIGLDQSKLKDFMLTAHQETVLGDTYYTGGRMAKEVHTGEIGQWQNGIVEITGAINPANVTSPLVYPKPAWPPAPAQ